MSQAEPHDRTDEPFLNRATLSEILGHLDEFLLGMSSDGTITYVSPTVRSVLGWDPEQMVGRSALHFLHPDEQEKSTGDLLRWAGGRAGNPKGDRRRARSPSGKWVDIHYDAVSGPHLGPLGDMVLTVRLADATDEERNALLEQLINQERMVRVASAFMHPDPGWFDRGIDQTVTELSGMPWVTRTSIWFRSGDRYHRRAQWEAQESPPLERLPWSLPTSALPWDGTLAQVGVHGLSELISDWAGQPPAGTVHPSARPVNNVLALPLVHGGQATGFLLVEGTLEDGDFGAGHVAAMRIAAAVTAEAMARQEAQRELEERARTDRLTNLPNRWTFRQALEEELAALRAERTDDPKAARATAGATAAGGTVEADGKGDGEKEGPGAATGSPTAVVRRLTARRPRAGIGVALVDLDRFKAVNDLLGHDTGDQLLMAVAERFVTAAALLHPRAMVARLSGDEFLLLHPECSSLRDVADAAHELLRSLDPPLYVDGHPVTMTAAAGVVYTPDHTSDAVELLRRADLAMYRAKGSGGDCIMGDDTGVRNQVAERLSEEAALRRAIEGDGLEVFMQGEWNLRDGALLGGEALVRWHHPRRGLLLAAEFVPLAEDTGLITDLGRRVMREACVALADWRRRGLAQDFVLRVNLSAQQLRSATLLEDITDLLADTNVPPSCLCMELTESSLLGDPEGAAATLRRVRDIGIGLSVDDFGTGYSSLLYLKALPLTSIKVDQAFVAGLPDHESDRAIVSAVVQLARAFNVDVVAEGVETTAQRQALLEIGCNWGQGYLLSKPEPLDIFGDRLIHSVG